MQEMDMLSIETQFRSETPAKIKCILFLPGFFVLFHSKFAIRKSLEQLEFLKSSLMQKYFACT